LPIGITFGFQFWGFLGACIELFGGLSLVLGFGTRIACVFLIGMMILATQFHLKRGDSFAVYSFPLSLIVIFIGYLIMGSGNCAFDNLLFKN
jgi:uncharacterized membrane protein YphA (DoxX/SURF4 family)